MGWDVSVKDVLGSALESLCKMFGNVTNYLRKIVYLFTDKSYLLLKYCILYNSVQKVNDVM